MNNRKEQRWIKIETVLMTMEHHRGREKTTKTNKGNSHQKLHTERTRIHTNQPRNHSAGIQLLEF